MSSEYFLSLSTIEAYWDKVLPSTILPVLSTFILATDEVVSVDGPKLVLPEVSLPPIVLTHNPGILYVSELVISKLLLVGTPKEAISAFNPL